MSFRDMIAKLEKNNERRRALTTLYREQLEELIPTIVVPFTESRGTSACHLFPILLPIEYDRTSFMEHMKTNGIQTSIHYPPIHKFQTYSQGNEALSNLPMTENVAGREVTLPLYAGLTDDNIAYVVQTVRSAFLKGINK